MEFALGELAERRQLNVSSHLEGCSDCSKSYQEILQALGDLDRWEVAPAAPDLTDRTLAALRKEQEK